MTNKNFTYSFKSSKSPEEIFELLLNIERWWSGLYEETIKGKSHQVNDEFTFKAGGGVHDTTQKVVELIPNKKIAWLVTKSNLSFLSNPNEWESTTFYFDLTKEDDKTVVTFIHDGLTPKIECYNACSTGWTGYLQNLEKKLK